MQVRPGTRRADIARRRPGTGGAGIKLSRVTLAIFLVLLGAGMAGYAVSSGLTERVHNYAQERVVALFAKLGYRVQTVLVEGRMHTDPELLREVIGQDKNSPLFAFNPETTRERLRKISWVKDVNVQRRLPDTIYIHLMERTPMALWQTDGKVAVIDETGTMLTRDVKAAAFKDLILIVGKGGETEAAGLLAQLEAEADLKKRVEAALWVGERRWDLKMNNGLIVKLPEDNLGLALRQLAKSQEQDHLLDKDIDLVDLRETDRFVIRTRPGAVREYKATLTSAGGEI